MTDSEQMQKQLAYAKRTMRCNCDLDNWQPELSTGHSHVCRIHKFAKRLMHDIPPEILVEIERDALIAAGGEHE